MRDLERFVRRLETLGYRPRHRWDKETWWVHDPSWTGPDERPTAFVHAHPDGREIDARVVRREGDELAAILWTAPYRFPRDGLRGQGLVAGRPVRCLTARMQRLAHTGYELPPTHRADLERLASGSRPPRPVDPAR